ncbi:MAG: phage head-tail connector protein [Hornefia butyriciproducens]|uniref:phage head-tail connector protein n=1 Tax=Hornefia butyriciproducens TaxID=2652293 RepID=UPI002A75E4E3|nr:phage head-tail connector protein [Hornefia butyriciproducens]MDY2991631.1 phage head-tail connector protein [Hornefia butyriciproducens]
MLEDIKTLLGLEGSERDALLQTIISMTTSRLKVLLGVQTVPEELSYIITEIAVVRYNRIGSEGLSSHSVEGESQSWSDTDFAPYQEEIDAYKAAQQTPARGRVRFL